jgi:hypothetical protein
MVLRDELRLEMMGVDERVVMSNAAAVRRFCTCGNNEVLLRQFFPTPLYCANRHVRMTGTVIVLVRRRMIRLRHHSHA